MAESLKDQAMREMFDTENSTLAKKKRALAQRAKEWTMDNINMPLKEAGYPRLGAAAGGIADTAVDAAEFLTPSTGMELVPVGKIASGVKKMLPRAEALAKAAMKEDKGIKDLAVKTYMPGSDAEYIEKARGQIAESLKNKGINPNSPEGMKQVSIAVNKIKSGMEQRRAQENDAKMKELQAEGQVLQNPETAVIKDQHIAKRNELAAKQDVLKNLEQKAIAEDARNKLARERALKLKAAEDDAWTIVK
jgi:hypothetical protein